MISTGADRTTPKLLARLSSVELATVYCQFVLDPAVQRGMDVSRAAPFSVVVQDRGRQSALEYLASEVNNRLGPSIMQVLWWQLKRAFSWAG